MIKCEVINEDFTLERFDELKNIQRHSKEEKGKLFKGDTFECTKEMADYLSGNNLLKKTVVKVIEVYPDEEVVYEEVEEYTQKDLDEKSNFEEETTINEEVEEEDKKNKKRNKK